VDKSNFCVPARLRWHEESRYIVNVHVQIFSFNDGRLTHSWLLTFMLEEQFIYRQESWETGSQLGEGAVA